MKGKITILTQDIAMCPTLFSVLLPDGSEGRLKYRWGIISLIKNSGKAMFDPRIEEDEYPKESDGYIEIEEAVKWLEKKGYEVDVSSFKDLTLD